MSTEVKLGQKVKCLVTNFEGTVSSITEYLHGCRRIGIQPPVGEDKKIPESHDIDEPQLIITDKKQVIKAVNPKALIKLGQVVTDPISGYEGIAMGRCIFINGCARVGVQKKYNPAVDKEMCGGKWFYEPQLKVVEKVVAKEIEPPKETRRTGGPGMMASYKHEKIK